MILTVPRLDGWGAIEAVKVDPSARESPISVLTAHALGASRDRALEAGRVELLTRPCSPQALLEHVERVLVRRPRRPDGPRRRPPRRS